MEEEQIRDIIKSIHIGEIRVIRLCLEYEESGFLVVGNTKNHEGVDILVISLPDGRIRKAIECTNFARPDEHIPNPRLQRYINYLCYFQGIKDIELEIVVSFKENINARQLEELKEHKIQVKVVGHQDLDYVEPEIKSWEE
jgi:hypothetical protein